MLFLILGLAAFSTATFDTRWRLPAAGVGLVLLFLGATAFSRAGQIAAALRPFVKKPVRVEVWGMPLPGSGETLFEIDSVSALGAGLLIHLRAASGGPRTLLKVAQPGSAAIDEGRIEIGEARYVSWAGRKIKPGAGRKTLAVALLPRLGERRAGS